MKRPVVPPIRQKKKLLPLGVAKDQSRGSEKSTRGHEQCDLLLQLALLWAGVVPEMSTGPV